MTSIRINIWISSKYLMSQWICLLFILIVLVGVELSLCVIVAPLPYSMFHVT